MKKIFLRLLFALVFLTPALLVRANDPSAVKARMAQRVSQIDEMKSRGVVGENNRGMLEAREGGGAAEQEVISAENKDREAAYAYIAEQNKTTVDMVARARARQIAQASVSGVWVQDGSGVWKKK